MQDSAQYKKKKSFFDGVITLYGRNVVLEVLQDENIQVHKLHMSDSNQIDDNIKLINSLARSRKVEITMHDKKSLSRISKNSKQDQGVCIDILADTYKSVDEIKKMEKFTLIALDAIQNPQNLGMIIRSCAAGFVDGIILPTKSSAKISPLVVKASAGTLFKLPIYYCNTLDEILGDLEDTKVYELNASASKDIYSRDEHTKVVYVLGNESEGLSKEVKALCNDSLSIPMNRGVESLNVAVTASLLAFLK